MSRLTRRLIVGCLCALVYFSGTPLTFSDSSLEESRKLLQKSLTIYEIDQEVARLNEQEAIVTRQIDEAGAAIAEKDGQVAETRKHAGKVLRAYYMGERQSIWTLLFSAKSFSDALVMYDYLSMIVANDERALTSYRSAYDELVTMKAGLEAKRSELVLVKDEFIKQRERVTVLQKELDEQLQAVADVPALQTQIQDLTKEWQEKGVPLFKTYFKAISGAMQSLPELLSGDNSKKYLSISGAGLVFQITDTDLNEFFRSKNELFRNMTFAFTGGQFTAAGQDNDITVSIKGRYTVENEPNNRLQFHVEELTFNGFVLPDTTNRSLEQEFNLGFSPQTYISQIEATDVTSEAGKLTIKMRLKPK